MTKTKKQDMKIWEVFTAAKKLLSTSNDDYMIGNHVKQIYICYAISEVYGTDSEYYWKRLSPAHKIIQERLEGCQTVREWLYKNVPDWYLQIQDLDLISQIQKYRHRWLDALIEEFKEKNL